MVLAAYGVVPTLLGNEKQGHGASGQFIRESERIVKGKSPPPVPHFSSDIGIALTINSLSHKHGAVYW
jgi:hypothetical protein